MTPLKSSWLVSMEQEKNTTTIMLNNGKKLRYTNVPEHVVRALQTADSPGTIWRKLMRGAYNETMLP